MDEVPREILSKLKLKDAAEEEGRFWRNLLPPEPWQSVVVAKAGLFANLAETRLQAGAINGTGSIINARKAHQAIRPVPALGIVERIIYRALSNFVLESVPLPKRSVDDYRTFIAAPMTHFFRGKSSFKLFDLDGYIIEADIAGFYQYIDHAILLQELELRTGRVHGARLLVQFLREIQGRRFGLPQLLHASDLLSELYIEQVERDLIRRNFDVWRYNDDFRFSVDKYGRAQEVTESLSKSAHDVGLLLNESKTRITKASTYFWRYSPRDEQLDPDIEVRPEDMEILTQYGEVQEDDALLERADEILKRLDMPEGESRSIQLDKLNPDQTRELRHAFKVLTKLKEDRGLPRVTDVMRFAPELTSMLCEYLVALSGNGCDVGPVWDETLPYSNAFNSWQRAWLIYVARVCKLAVVPSRRQWILAQLKSEKGDLTHAEACLTLAEFNEVSFGELDLWIRTQPEAFSPWYVLSVNKLPSIEGKRANALRDSSPLYKLLLDS